MSIGIPAGIENGMFQFGKIAIQSTVSTMGTTVMSAQAMTNIFEMANGLFANGVGIGFMTVVGQCIGANRVEEAKHYIVKLMGVAWVGAFGLPYGLRAAIFSTRFLSGKWIHGGMVRQK